MQRFYDVASSDAETVHAMWTDLITGRSLNYNIGVSTDNMIVVDIDMKNGKDGMASYRALGLPLNTFMVKTPTGGWHAYFKGPNRGLSVDRLGSGLDIRSFHGYVLAPGSVIDARLYVIDNDAPMLDAPQFLLDRLDAPRERTGDNTSPACELDTPAALARAAAYLTIADPAVEGAGGDALTYRVAARVKDFGVSAVSALELMAIWDERCQPSWGLDALWSKIENVYAYGQMPPGIDSPAVAFAGVDIDVPPPVVTLDDDWQYHGDPLVTDARWLFYELLSQTGVGVLSGPSQGGKTFVLMQLARCLATGKRFFGIEPDERGGTILLTGEGKRSVNTRMQALREPNRLPIATCSVSNLSAPGALDTLAAKLRAQMDSMEATFGVPVRMIAIDTLSASGLLRDENDNSEAGVAMAALARLAEMLDVFLIVTHHPPKDGKGQRGAGALFNDVDIVLEIVQEKTNSIRELQVTKARDAQQRTLGVFTLVQELLDHDSRGRPITSCSVSDAPPTARNATNTPGQVETLLQSVEWAIVDDGVDVDGQKYVPIDAVREAFKMRYHGNTGSTVYTQKWAKALAWTLDTGALRIVPREGVKYVTRPVFESPG